MSLAQQLLSSTGKSFIAYFRNPKNILKEIAVILFSIIIIARVKNQVSGNMFTITSNMVVSNCFLSQYQIRDLLGAISEEKISNYKEYMLINGMTKAAYYGKHLFMSYKSAILNGLSVSLGYWFLYDEYFTDGFFGVFVAFFLSGVAVSHLSLFLSNILPPGNAVDIGGFGNLFSGLLYFIISGTDSTVLTYLFSIFPVCSTSIGLFNQFFGSYSFQSGNIWIINLIIFCSSLFYLYLFAITESRSIESKNKKTHGFDDSLTENMVANSAHFYEEVDINNVSVRICNLFKSYEKKEIIKGLSLTIKEGEIFCLLGHNGAGKSTIVNILTGLVPATSGQILYYDKDFAKEFDSLRNMIGFCPQKDILEDKNTVEENIQLIAEIKGMSSEGLKEQVDQVIKKCGLENFRKTLAENLSGGNKRKLCLARALIGGAKIIILDEPSSGMDPNSRRIIWNIIKSFKREGKTVLLTTQFLDEAEELSDRVSVLVKGNIFALGTVEYIKRNFGVGYRLTLSVKDNDQKVKLEQLVENHIKSSTKESQSSQSILQYVLPFSEQSKFSALFSALEEQDASNINLQMGNLEEAFINIGLNPDYYLSKKGLSSEESENQTGLNLQIESLDPPSCYFKERKYDFYMQFKAMFLRRLYNFSKNPSSIIFFIVPAIFVILVFTQTLTPENETTNFPLVSSMIAGIPILVYCLNCASFVSHLAIERETKITSTLKVMGLRPLPYWLATFTADSILACVSIFVSMIPIMFQDGQGFDSYGKFVIIGSYLLYQYNSIAMAYLFGILIPDASLVSKAYPGFVMMGYVAPEILALAIPVGIVKTIISSIALFLGPTQPIYFAIYVYFYNINPGYMTDTLVAITPVLNVSFYMIFSFVYSTICLLLTFYLENKKYKLQENKASVKEENVNEDQIVEEDVEFEKQRLRSGEGSNLIRAYEVDKVYPNGFKALNSLSFGVESGQIFGLLGPNGAGKSTTFNILSAGIPLSSGSVRLLGEEINNGIYHVFDQVGLCPQVNPLWGDLTVIDHLKIFGYLKSIPEEEIKLLTEYFLDALELRQFAKTKASALSGGNKRKLCVANALIGAPKVMFLDEPSTGVDPIARKYLWNCLKASMNGRNGAMVLTTHYMQEAESLSSKLGIIINGRLSCIGTMTDLAKRFGQYTIMIREAEDKTFDLGAYMKTEIPEAKKVSSTGEKAKFYKISCDEMRFSHSFKVLEDAKSKGKISEFSIYTSTLEQIFLKLSKYQRTSTL